MREYGPMLLIPHPNRKGIERTKAIMAAKGRPVTDEEAARLLGGIMQYIHLVRQLEAKLEEKRAVGEWPPGRG